MAVVEDARSHLLLRTKTNVALALAANKAAPRVEAAAEWEAPESAVWSPDGSRAAFVHRSHVVIASGPNLESTLSIPEEHVQFVSFSPLGSYVVTWMKRPGGVPAPAGGEDAPEARNLKVWRADTGERLAAFQVRSFEASAWPLFKWSSDERVCARMVTDAVLLVEGSFSSPSAEPIGRIVAPGIAAFWISPGPAPYSFTTFVPRTKAKPGAVALYVYPRLAEPVVAKAMQADGARASYAPDGSAVLVEMSTAASAESYYGDSRLFILTRDGKISAPVALAKEGPIHDFAWCPKPDGGFIVISGKTPPEARLHNRAGVPVFSFGTGGYNTVRVSPTGRFAIVGGFGNMGGDLALWDLFKQKPLCHTFKTSGVVSIEWSPCGRYFMTATTRPRLNVDNGVTIYTHRGGVVVKQGYDALFQAVWRPLPPTAVVADRAASPPPGPEDPYQPPAAPAPAAVYRPRGAGGSSIAAIMSAGTRSAGKIGAADGAVAVATAAAAAPAAAAVGGGKPLPVGYVPPTPGTMSEAAKKRAKAREKKAAEAERAAAEAALAADLAAASGGGGAGATPAAAPAPAPAAAYVAPPESEEERTRRKLVKKMKEIEALQAVVAEKGEAGLNADQKAKLASAAEVAAKIAELDAIIAAAAAK